MQSVLPHLLVLFCQSLLVISFGNFSDLFLLDWHNKTINFHESTRCAVLDLRLSLSLLSWPNPASKTQEIDIYLYCVGSMKFICCCSVPLMKLLWCKLNIKYLLVYVPEQSWSFGIGKLDVSLWKHQEIHTSHVVWLRVSCYLLFNL